MKTTFLRSTVITAHRAFGLSLGLALALLSATTAQGVNYTLGATHCWEGPASGTDSVVLGVNPTNGVWNAATSTTWLHLSAANQSGTGSTNVVFTFDANPGATRSGMVVIADQTLTVTQAGSTYVAAPAPVTALVSSGLNFPFGVAVDGAGNVYIGDSDNNAIKEWIAASNTVSTLVSSGLNVPAGVALDGAGNVYFADMLNNAIKEWVAASNSVVTLVSSGLNDPYDVAVDGAGNVYIADTYNSAIKEWIAASNTVTTLVSSGLLGPWSVAVDGAGNVYIADTGNNAVKEWVAASHTLITLVSSGLSQPSGVVVDGSGNVYFTDIGHSAIKEWVAASHAVVTLVSSGLNQPTGAAVDGSGNVYIADYYNYAIKELPRAFVDPTARSEGPAAGSDVLPMVLPATENLRAPFAPASDQSWLNITNVTNGVVSFSFTGTTTNRIAHLTLLGQAIAINQQGLTYTLGTTNLLEGPGAGSDSVVLAVNTPNGPWTAAANATWLHLSAANQNGMGSTNVVFTFDANPGATRSGTLTIAGQTLTITQAGSTYVRAPGPVTELVSSGLHSPSGVAVDGAGNVYFADYFNNAVKEWVAASNTAITLVSSGVSQPNDVAVDGAGNVYIADSVNNAIKEWVAASNTLVTLVSSGLNNPTGVAVDGAGNVYIADQGNNAIKEWVAARHTLTTLVSSGLSYPEGVAVDGAGNVYIADQGNNAIKEWVAASNTLVTLVSSGLSYPAGVAVDGAGNVYIDDAANNAIKEWVAASHIVITNVAGLSGPDGVAVDGAGNIYIADTGNNAIKELPRAFVDPTARWEKPFAGSDSLPVVLPPTENLHAPFAPTSDQPWLTIASVTNGVVSFSFTGTTTNRTAHLTLLGQVITINQQGPTFTLGTTNLLEGPDAGSDSVVLGVNPTNETWIATTNATWLHLSAAIQSGTGSTNVVFTFDANPGGTRTGTLTIAGQTLTVTQAGSTYVRAPGPLSTLVSSGLSGPWSVAVDGAGNVYIADTANNAIKEWVAASNTVVTLVSSGLNFAEGVAVDSAGNVYIADTANNAVKEWVAASHTVVTLVSSGLYFPSGVAVDDAGNVYIADCDHNAIKEWVAASNTVVTLVSSGLSYPFGVAVDGAGNVYIADNHNNAIKEWMAASHTVVTLVSSGLSQPYGVAVDGAGNVYIADFGNNAIKEWVAASHTVITNVSSGLWGPTGVAVDGAGNVYIADYLNNAIKELPRAFVDPTARWENPFAGSDVLPVVLPATENLRAPFTPTSDQTWLTITGVTNGVVSYAFTGNTANSSRTAHLTLLGQSIPITQYSLANYASLGATNLLEGPGAGGDSVVLAVNMPNGPWTATANATWLHLSAANQSGTGSTNVVFTFDANPGATRSGTLTIAGQTLTVTQAGSTYVRAPGPVTALVSSGLNGPNGVAVDGTGNVYIADHQNNAVKEWVAASNTVVTLVSSGLNQPSGVAVDGAGNVYIADSGHNQIKEWVAASNTVITLVSSGLSSPASVAVDGAGNVYIADSDYNNSAIREWVAASHTVVTLVSSGLLQPYGVAVDGAGNVYIADLGHNAIKEWVAASHTVTTLVSSGFFTGVAVDGAGNVYITDSSNNAIKEWVAASNTVVTLVSSGLNNPWGVAVDGARNVYIADSSNNAIKELPRTFVDPTARSEGAAAGADSLPVVLPPTENLRVPFAPTSDQPWLNITGVNNGVVGFSFTGTTTNRTARITLLGQAIAIYQSGLLAPPTLVSPVVLANGSFQFAFSNTVPGASFTVWSATNLALPLADWTAVATSTNCAAGRLQFTIPLNPNAAQCFYDLRSP